MLENILKKYSKAKAIDLALKNDKGLLVALLLEPALKERFFEKVAMPGSSGAAWVFKQSEFCDFLSDKNFLANSYTKYKNKIGLNIGNKFLNQRGEVALVWPFKDCVLEGGATKDEENRKERFFNTILAQDEIDQLFSPKVLTAATRFAPLKEGTECLPLKRDDDGVLRENLIIKGNNLLALHTLKQQFQGKIKLIYIDPPYNTGNDSFNYNDNFNHSTWLTFMKNRLEVARDLLKDDGVIFVNIDEGEQAYLKISMDEIFGRENFICNFLWKKKGTSTNVKGVQISQQCDFILCFGKTSKAKIKIRVKTAQDRDYPYSDEEGNYRLAVVEKRDTGEYQRETMKFEILGITPREGKRWQIGKEKAKELEKKKRFAVQKGIVKLKIYDFEEIDSESAQPTLLDDYGTTDEANKEVNGGLFGGEYRFINPKPERLLQHLISIASDEGDVVLDFFAGSGTTGAVAMKMKRQFILVEQMDYVENITVERLKKVIKGEQGGISKVVGWQGGGSFIYLELMKYNEVFVEKIQKAKTTSELLKIWQDMQTKSFLNYDTPVEKINQTIADFKKLPFAEQKQFLFDQLNKNQLYVPLSSIDDTDFKVPPPDKTLNNQFYGL